MEQKMIKDEYITIVNENSAKVKEQKKKRMKEQKNKATTTDKAIVFGLLFALVLLVAGIFIKANLYPDENGKGHWAYTENSGNGNHFEWVED